ncbi:MAG TPA: glycosyltransferase family 4 protein [Gaiellaceae bacterium]|nr:glycosyltransferase family 4 protein [Gaiellaceae bacterium]
MRERPRVLIVVTLAETGGAQTYVASLLPALVEEFDVVVAAHGPGPLWETARRAGARAVPLEHVRRPLSPWRDLRGLLELVALLRRERPDIIHANSSKAGVLGRVAAALSGVPIRIFTVHGWAFSAHTGIASALYKRAERMMRPLTTVTICVAESERVAGLANRACDPERTIVIRNGVDVDVAVPTRGDGAEPTVVAVGRLQRPKDSITLARALGRVRASFSAVIVGEGPDRPRLEAEIRRLGLEQAVVLAGDRSDVADLLTRADVFALSSTSEGLPLSILEAMAAALPVVASSVGGVPEAVEDGETGLLVPPRDPVRLAAALERLLVEPALRRRLGANGRERVREHFGLEAFRQAHVDVYRRELVRRGRAAPSP